MTEVNQSSNYGAYLGCVNCRYCKKGFIRMLNGEMLRKTYLFIKPIF